MTKKSNIHIGTSGWHYQHWAGTFYPDDLDKEGYLDYYSQRLKTVEINNSFYQLPGKDTFEQWRITAPKDFVFSVKASRYITHMKKLKDPEDPVETFLERVSILGDKLGPILFQLPPNWRPNVDRLRSFLEVLPEGHRYTFEFRDSGWFTNQVYDVLRDHQAAFCFYNLAGRKSPREINSDHFVYIRLHGPGDAYQGKYDNNELAGWAGAISAWSSQGKAVFCYFDNDQRGYAIRNAQELRQMLETG